MIKLHFHHLIGLWRKFTICAIILLWVPTCLIQAQINTDRVMIMGRSALYYEDYVLSIQRFSLVINAKPHLAEPYFYRGLAKFYLEDYQGAEVDVSNAISRNPYTSNYYVLRALCRVNTQKYADAEQDYQKSLNSNPQDADSWHNMVLCQIEQKEYQRADSCLDIMIKKWPDASNNYSIKAQLALINQDSVKAESWIDRALDINAFEGSALSMKSMFLLLRYEYAEAENVLTKAIVQLPRNVDLYINRAMARYNLDNLRGAMSDYDAALEINDKSQVGHYNRALLRAQVGDDNHAIEDFNFVIENEPDNYIAIYNRAILLNNTGDLNGALRDITTILNEYPEFWDGYTLRAAIRRKVGDRYGAERDEFKVLKARMEGTTHKGKKKSNKKTRKESDKDLEDYNKLVESDPSEFHEQYTNEYRGKVQDRHTDAKPEKSFVLSYYTRESFAHETTTYIPLIEKFNNSMPLLGTLYLTNDEGSMGDDGNRFFEDISVTSLSIDRAAGQMDKIYQPLLRRALDYYHVRDFESAILDLDVILQTDDKNVIARFLRAQMTVALYMGGEDKLSKEDKLELNKAIDDLNVVYQIDKDFIFALYNIANIYYYMGEYAKTIETLDKVIAADSHFPEAYFNRGLALIMDGQVEKGLADLSQAGEYGIYTAYNLIKRYSKK